MFVQNIQLEFFTASFNLSITYCEGKSFSMMRGSIREAPLHREESRILKKYGIRIFYLIRLERLIEKSLLQGKRIVELNPLVKISGVLTSQAE